MDTQSALNQLLTSTQTEELWRAAHLIHSHAGNIERKAVLKALWNEPAGERQEALMEAVRPGTDPGFVELITRVLLNEGGSYSDETRAIAADWLTPVVELKEVGMTLLMACLADRAPSVRRSAVCVASHFQQIPAVRVALEKLRNDHTVVSNERISELVDSILESDIP